MVTLEVVKMTASGATSDRYFVKMTTFSFQFNCGPTIHGPEESCPFADVTPLQIKVKALQENALAVTGVQHPAYGLASVKK